ncbi:MAG: protein kinase [Isosphaeraceae bacterium]|nr:protein kinase [Isosphaeraceae bacterium]
MSEPSAEDAAIGPHDDSSESADARIHSIEDFERHRAIVELLDRSLRPIAFPSEPVAPDASSAGGGALGKVGRFRLERELGRGGFGIVFLAYDPEMGRRVALKIPRADAMPAPDTRRRFLKEARAAARLDHPNLVPVFEAGEAGPFCYIASAYCEGPTLRNRLDASTTPFDPRSAARLALTLARAIEHMHVRGLLHCDLKPANVILEPAAPGVENEAVPRITDFGLARLFDVPIVESTAIRPWGSPPYMAPEQIEQRRDAIGPPTDVYAIGAILCELLTGRPPHSGETVWELVRAVVAQPPLSPRREVPGVPADLDAIALKCLEKRPDRRYASASDLADDLERFLERRPTRARPLGAVRRAARWAARNPAGSALMVLAVLAAMGGVGSAMVLRKANRAALRALEGERGLRYVASLSAAEGELRLGRYAQAQRLLRELNPSPGSTEPDRRDFAFYYLERQARRERTVLDDLFPSPSFSVCAGGDLLLADGSASHGGGVWHFDLPKRPAPPHLGAARPLIRFERPPGFEPGAGILGTLTRDGRLAALMTTPPRSDKARLILVDLVAGRILASDETSPLLHAPIDFNRHGDTLTYGTKREGRSLDRVELAVDGRTITAAEVRWSWGSLFTGDGARVVSIEYPGPTIRDCRIRLFDVATGRLIATTESGAVAKPIAVAPTAGGPIAACSLAGEIQLRDAGTLAVIASIPLPRGVSDPPNALAFSPDSTRLVAAHDRVVVLRETEGGREIARFEGFSARVDNLAFLPNRPGEIALSLATGEVVIQHAEPVEASTIPLRHGDEVWDVAFVAGGRRLISFGGDHLIRRFDMETGRELGSLVGHEDWPSCLAVDPSGRIIASGDFSGRVMIWDEEAGRLVREFAGGVGRIRAIEFSADGGTLAYAGRDRSIRLVNTKNWRPSGVLSGHELDVRGVAFSPDGRTLAAVGDDAGLGDDAAVVLWDLATLRERSRVQASIDVSCVAFSPDGRTLAVGDIGGSITLRDPVDGSIRSALPGRHGEEIVGLAFSPDGRVLAAAGQDGVVSLLDVNTGRSHLSLLGHAAGVNAVAFSPDGRVLGSASHDCTVRLWWAGPDMPER